MNAVRRHTALLEILDEAMEADHASFGNIQLLNDLTGGLEIAVSRGFDQPFLDYFRSVPAECPSACGRALMLGQRVQVRDVAVDPYFTPFLEVASDAGFRSVQSTPIPGPGGRTVGIISTHFKSPNVLSRPGSERLDRCAAKAGRLMRTPDEAA